MSNRKIGIGNINYRKLRKRVKYHSLFTPTLRRQFLVPLIFIVLSVLATVGITSIKISQQVIHDHTVRFGDKMLTQTAHRLSSLIDNAQVTVDSLILDRRLAPLLHNLSSEEPQIKEEAGQGLYDLLLQYRATLLPGAELVVMDQFGNVVTTFGSQLILRDLPSQTFVDKLKVWRLRFVPYYNSIGSNGRMLELTAKIVSLPWQPQSGWIILYLDYRIVESIMTNISLQENTANRFQSDAVVYGPDRQVIFPWDSFPDPLLDQAYQRLSGQLRNTESIELKVNGDHHLIIAARVPWTPWEVFISAPTKRLYAGLSQIYDSIFMIGLICTIIAVSAVTLISFFVTKPVNKLRRVMRLVEEGDLSVRAPEDGPVEIKALGRAFNRMLNQVDILTKRLVAEERKRRTAVLKALQAQIAPHFLFNTLAALAGMTAKRSPQKVAEALRSLKRLLYLSIGKDGDFVTLAEEFEYIHHYIYLMNIRYPDNFRLQLDLPEELRNCRTLRLILQPIAENALQHGLKFKSGVIKISACQENEALMIKVIDNGVGMSENEIRNIWKQRVSKSGIGLRNVDERLKLSFGAEFGLALSSEKGKGTTVLIRLPMQYLSERTQAQVRSGPQMVSQRSD